MDELDYVRWALFRKKDKNFGFDKAWMRADREEVETNRQRI